MKKILLALASILIVATTAFAVTDYLLKSPSGNLILDAATGYVVKINKTLQVDNIKNLAGTSSPPGMVPIGGMVAVMPTTHANAWQPPTDCSTIKDGFMRTSTLAGVACTVPVCADCIIPAGTTLPNMYQKYTKGSGTSGTIGGANGIYLSTANIPQQTVNSAYTSINHRHTTSDGAGGHGHTIWTDYSRSGFGVAARIQGAAGSYTGSNDCGTLYARFGSSLDYCQGTVGGWGAGLFTDGQGAHNHTTDYTDVNHLHGVTVGTALNTVVNNEPAYVEVVWVIRVK